MGKWYSNKYCSFTNNFFPFFPFFQYIPEPSIVQSSLRGLRCFLPCDIEVIVKRSASATLHSWSKALFVENLLLCVHKSLEDEIPQKPSQLTCKLCIYLVHVWEAPARQSSMELLREVSIVQPRACQWMCIYVLSNAVLIVKTSRQLYNYLILLVKLSL